jgi:hypothetical protein
LLKRSALGPGLCTATLPELPELDALPEEALLPPCPLPEEALLDPPPLPEVALVEGSMPEPPQHSPDVPAKVDAAFECEEPPHEPTTSATSAAIGRTRNVLLAILDGRPLAPVASTTASWVVSFRC